MLFTEEYLKRKIKLTMSRTGFIAPAGVTSIIQTLFIPKTTICPSVSPACCVNHILKKSSRHCSTRCCFWTSFARICWRLTNRHTTPHHRCPHETRTRRHRTAQSRRPVEPGAENGLYPQCRRSVCFAGGGKSLKTVAGFRGSVPCIRPLHNPKDPFVPRKRLSAPFFLQSFGISAMIGTVKRTKGRYGV